MINRYPPDIKKILITGGTSGLGLALVRYFLQKGCDVTATGRKEPSLTENNGRFTFLRVDFCSLKETSDVFRELCSDNRFDVVINNAGVLSPPDFLLTGDGLEYTFQVNFLSHLLLNEIIIRNMDPGQRLTIASVVSMAYRIAGKELIIKKSGEGYRPFGAYSGSKLLLALMSSYLPLKYPSYDLRCIGFDPLVFSSGIYRMQKGWFRSMYGIAAPFMKDPGIIAARLGELIERGDLINGAIYKSSKHTGTIPETGRYDHASFWNQCYEILGPLLERVPPLSPSV